MVVHFFRSYKEKPGNTPWTGRTYTTLTLTPLGNLESLVSLSMNGFGLKGKVTPKRERVRGRLNKTQ